MQSQTACIIHSAHNRKQMHVRTVTDINANTKITSAHYTNTLYALFTMHTNHMHSHTHKILVHIKANMHYSQTHELKTCMNMQSDTSAHCTNTVCALYMMHAYANTNKSHPYALKITSALTQMHFTNILHALSHNAHHFKRITLLHVHAITALLTIHTYAHKSHLFV